MNFLNLFNKALKVANELSNSSSALPQKLGGAKTIQIPQIPDSVEAFITLRNELATTPEGGAAMLVVAAIKYTTDELLGRHFAIIATDKNWLTSSNSERAYKGFDLGNSADFSLKQINDKKYIPFSYIKGANRENGYVPSGFPYQIAFERSTDGGDGNVKVYIITSGTDTTRPITMKKNQAGIWKCVEYSSLFTGIRVLHEQSRGEADGDF